jgi:hypothetical protein
MNRLCQRRQELHDGRIWKRNEETCDLLEQRILSYKKNLVVRACIVQRPAVKSTLDLSVNLVPSHVYFVMARWCTNMTSSSGER